MFRWFLLGLKKVICSPFYTFLFCLFLLMFVLVFDGTFLRLWSMNKEIEILSQSITQLKIKEEQLNQQIAQANSIQFIEQQARERFELVDENDLLFLFPGVSFEKKEQ